MEARELTDELARVARSLGIEVRVAAMRLPRRSAGGLCRVHGKLLIVLDQKQPPIDRAGTLAEAIADSGADWEVAELSETARTVLERAQERRTRMAVGAPAPGSLSIASMLGPKPGVRRARPRRIPH